jgi:hypothetical protein
LVISEYSRFRARKVFKGANALSLLQTPPVTKVCDEAIMSYLTPFKAFGSNNCDEKDYVVE